MLITGTLCEFRLAILSLNYNGFASTADMITFQIINTNKIYTYTYMYIYCRKAAARFFVHVKGMFCFTF